MANNNDTEVKQSIPRSEKDDRKWWQKPFKFHPDDRQFYEAVRDHFSHKPRAEGGWDKTNERVGAIASIGAGLVALLAVKYTAGPAIASAAGPLAETIAVLGASMTVSLTGLSAVSGSEPPIKMIYNLKQATVSSLKAAKGIIDISGRQLEKFTQDERFENAQTSLEYVHPNIIKEGHDTKFYQEFYDVVKSGTKEEFFDLLKKEAEKFKEKHPDGNVKEFIELRVTSAIYYTPRGDTKNAVQVASANKNGNRLDDIQEIVGEKKMLEALEAKTHFPRSGYDNGRGR